MAVESAADLAAFFDPNEFAETVTWTPKAGGGSSSVDLILDQKAERNDFLTPGVVSEQWAAWVMGSAVPGGVPVMGDSFVAARGTFEVLNDPIADDTGAVFRLVLRKTA